MQFIYTVLAFGWLLLLVYLMWMALTAKKHDSRRIWHLAYAALSVLAATLLTITLEHLANLD